VASRAHQIYVYAFTKNYSLRFKKKQEKKQMKKNHTLRIKNYTLKFQNDQSKSNSAWN